MGVLGMLALKAERRCLKDERKRGLTKERVDGLRVTSKARDTDIKAREQGDAAPASLLKKPVTKKDGNDESDDDEFYDRTASRAKVSLAPPLPPPPPTSLGPEGKRWQGRSLQHTPLGRSLDACVLDARLGVCRLLGGPRHNSQEDAARPCGRHSREHARGQWSHRCCRACARTALATEAAQKLHT